MCELLIGIYNVLARIQKLETSIKILDSSVSWLMGSKSPIILPCLVPPESYQLNTLVWVNYKSETKNYPSPTSSSTGNSPDALIDLTNTQPHQSKAEKPGSVLEILAANKKANPLPEIDKSNMLSPEIVVKKYPKLANLSNIPRLAVKLCRESYFGSEIMKLCTVRGTGQYHALPQNELKELKVFLLELCVPQYVSSRFEFETTWKTCVESIGQACKSLRNK